MIHLIDSRSIFFLNMYFLEKLCRLCVRTGMPLVDIDTVDFDSVRLSEKLEVCTKMSISKDHVSSDICEKCVNKLRVSYHFLDMCKKSTKIIQGYLEKLLGTDNVEALDSHCSSFENSELSTVVDKLPESKLEHLKSSLEQEEHSENFEQYENDENEREILRKINVYEVNEIYLKSRKKQRITKEKRCSLLKRLLNRPRKERDKPVFTHNNYDYEKGGLKNIIDFANNYEFSFNLDKNSNIESTPLDKLTAFSTNYFQRDFTEFKNHILYVIENRDRFECCSSYSSDDEDFISGDEMEGANEGGGRKLEFEEVMVEPDIKIKSELMDCEDEGTHCPLDYLETSFEEEEEEIGIKKEEVGSDSENDPVYHLTHMTKLFPANTPIKEDLQSTSSLDNLDSFITNYKSSLSIDSSPSVKLLDNLVASYPMGSRKVFSASNMRCRTRDQPYINPLLKDQFLRRSFKCERCNRYFKSQGYLKAHTSKVH